MPTNPFPGLVDDKIIPNKLVDAFKEYLNTVCIPRCPENLLNDCALICAFLQSGKVFEGFYINHVDPVLKNEYLKQKSLLPGTYDRSKGGALMRAFYELMKGHGFSTLRGVVFTGNAGGFLDVVANRILFKDMTGPMHGEFTHSLQWLAVCRLRDLKMAGLFEGNYTFNNAISDVYAKIVTVSVYWLSTTPFISRNTYWPGEISFKTKAVQSAAPKTLWDFIVDAFSATEHQTKTPLATEDPLENLYTDSYRCPANITVAMQFGALKDTFIGGFWSARSQKYELKVQPHTWYHPNRYRKMAVGSQKLKGQQNYTENTWVSPHETPPRYIPEWPRLNPHLVPSLPTTSLRDIDWDTAPDEWEADDDF